MIKSGIYKITAIHNGEFYIGSSNDIQRRWERHRHYLKNNCHQNKILQRIYNKYGKDCFTFEVVEYIEKENLQKLEQQYMDNLNPSLNLRKIAISNQGLKHSDEAKEKMRQAHLGKKLSEEHRQKLSKAFKGKKLPKHSEQQKDANAKRQAKFNDEQIWQIKWLGWLGLSCSEIAQRFDVVNTTIWTILNNKKRAYNHVDFDPSFPKLY